MLTYLLIVRLSYVASSTLARRREPIDELSTQFDASLKQPRGQWSAGQLVSWSAGQLVSGQLVNVWTFIYDQQLLHDGGYSRL